MFQKERRHIKVKILNCYGSRINNFDKHYKIAQKRVYTPYIENNLSANN